MRRRNGFTLIELLAIIVILAIIAVITVPIILDIIDNSKRGAARNSAYGYKESINKFYLDKLSVDKSFTLMNRLYGISELRNMGVSVGGNEPTDDSWIEIENDMVVGGCLQFDEYKVDITGGEVGNVVKGGCISEPVSFETDSWLTIKRAINEDNTDLYSVGDTKEVLTDGVSYTVRLSNKTFDGCDTVENGFSQTACGFVFEFIDTIGDNYSMNSTSTNVGGWTQSILFNYLNNDIYNKLPSDLKSVIADTYGRSGCGKDDWNCLTTFTSRLYLLSIKELYGGDPNEDTARYFMKQLEYYYGKSNIISSWIKYSIDGNENSYWTRTADAYYSIDFYFVTDIGYRSYVGASDMHGVAPAFRIVKD